jgi:hypothetical protein
MKSLRHGFGCRYAARVPAQVLQKLMRHASIKTTTDYYTNVDDAAIAAVLGARRARVSGDAPAAAERQADLEAANLVRKRIRNSGEPRPMAEAPRCEESSMPPSTSD